MKWRNGMTTETEAPMFSARVTMELTESLHRVNSLTVFERIWEMMLTPAERASFPGGMAEAWAQHRTVGLWMHLRRCSDVRAIIDLAEGLGFLMPARAQWLRRETGEDVEDFEATIQRFRLVIVEAAHEVYWGGVLIGIDWDRHRALWDYFVTVCERAKRGQSISSGDFSERRKPHNPSHQKSRLLAMPEFPGTLEDLLRVSGGRHRLHVPPEQIHFIRNES
jgi:hypothetical protein